jgi:site-specific recombinase XerD
LHLSQERKLMPKGIRMQMSALRFLYFKTLHRNFRRDDLVLPKAPRQELPVVLSREEVARLIESAANLRHRTILMTLYATGMRRSELCGLRPEDIDAQRMVLHILHGKGGRKRDVPLNLKSEVELYLAHKSLRQKGSGSKQLGQTGSAGNHCSALWRAGDSA